MIKKITAKNDQHYLDVMLSGGDTRKFKILKGFCWDSIPKFAAITGKNGIGKSALLELIDARVGSSKGSNTFLETVDVETSSDFDLKSGNYVSLLKSGQIQELKDFGVADVVGMKGNDDAVERFKKRVLGDQIGDHDGDRKVVDFIEQKEGVSVKEFLENSPGKMYGYMNEISGSTIDVVHLIIHQIPKMLFGYYRSNGQIVVERTDDELEMRRSFEEKLKVGRDNKEKDAPWNVINELFAKYGFKYRVNSPSNIDSFSLFFFDKNHPETKLDFRHLSFGEKLIASLILLSFNDVGKMKKIILLDEPDAHLDPEFIKILLDVVKNVLVKRYGIQVIMTTHNPSTISLLNDDSVFVLDKDGEVLKIKNSHTEAMEALTKNLLLVNKDVRIVFVEDEDDEIFYKEIYRYLTNNGYLQSFPPLIFKKSSSTKGDGGGCSKVKSLLKKLNDGDIRQSPFRGVVDGDGGNNASDQSIGLQVLNRYSFENYLIDPVIIFQRLKSLGIISSSVATYDVDTQKGILKDDNQPEDFVEKEVILCDDRVVKLPQWILLKRGHDLTASIKNHFLTKYESHPELKKINGGLMDFKKLTKIMVEEGLVPKELKLVLEKLI